MARHFNPRAAALAYRIWAYCTPRGWNCTVREVADDLGESVWTVKKVVQDKKWHDRLAGVQRHSWDAHGSLMAEVDDQLRIGL